MGPKPVITVKKVKSNTNKLRKGGGDVKSLDHDHSTAHSQDKSDMSVSRLSGRSAEKNNDPMIGSDQIDKEKELSLEAEVRSDFEEDEEKGEDYGWDTNAKFYITEAGDIINEGVLTDPESSVVSGTMNFDDLELPDNDNFREWAALDPSDDEEQDDLRERFFDKFKIKEVEKEFGKTETDMASEDDPFPGGLDVFLDASHVGVIPSSKFLKLDLSGLRVTNLAMIEQFPNLRFLRVSKNFIRNVRCLGKLKSLISLDVADNEITKFLDMSSQALHPLQEVNFSKNQITEIVSFQKFLALINISLAYNRLKTIDKFQHCYFLRFLNLSHNEISDIQNLDCPHLIVLLLQDNKLLSISSLSKCQELRYLNISKNKICDLAVLKFFPRLTEFRCAHNHIDLIQTDHALKPLVYLSHLRITPNPCTKLEYSRLMLIFTLPQIRYLDKEIILPEEIVEANNIFKPSFEKLAFEDHRSTMLEKATQSAYMMFQEFCEMHPLPPILFLVGTSKSRSEVLAMHLKQQFRHKVHIGGVHSTATTIESGNHHIDNSISLENFLDMKKRGQFFSTVTVLGRLCGFSATQFIKASEHGSLLIGITIPLVTAICLRKWGFKAKCVLIMPSDAPHFHVDKFLEKEKRRLSLHHEDEKVPKSRNRRLISFAAGDKSPQSPQPRHSSMENHSILKKKKSTTFEVKSLAGEISSKASDTEHEVKLMESMRFDVGKLLDSGPGSFGSGLSDEQVGGGVITEGEKRNYKDAREWKGEESSRALEEESHKTHMLSIFGVDIINPASVEGIDWKRTILWTDFYDAILNLDDDHHFLLTRNQADTSAPLSEEILEETLATLGYDLIHGPAPVYTIADDTNPPNPTKSDAKYQLIVVRLKRSTTALEVEVSCVEPRKVPESLPFLVCEDGGEGVGGGKDYIRPSSPWYRRFAGGENDDEEIIGEEALAALIQQDIEEDDDEEEDHDPDFLIHKKFRHRYAIECSILRTRDEYVKYHLENPGFFSAVLDTRDEEGSKIAIEQIAKEMLDEFKEDETNSKLYPPMDSYAQLGSVDVSSAFIEERLEVIRKMNHEWLRGYDYPAQRRNVTESGDSMPTFRKYKCPKDILNPTISYSQRMGHVYQLQRTESFRKEKDKQKLEQAILWSLSRHERKSTTPSPTVEFLIGTRKELQEEHTIEAEMGKSESGESGMICEDGQSQPQTGKTIDYNMRVPYGSGLSEQAYEGGDE